MAERGAGSIIFPPPLRAGECNHDGDFRAELENTWNLHTVVEELSLSAGLDFFVLAVYTRCFSRPGTGYRGQVPDIKVGLEEVRIYLVIAADIRSWSKNVF
ncbi:hypothetical protein VM1G_11942 [Cytospora mali]|uniref:Uncharacterized protein n=1 Tax=Cytospora mali TaxID=578113 RepID=A0A194WAZ0_CYTMA|nr:hypothetical protein VM1G_11942 [Valsa mali]